MSQLQLKQNKTKPKRSPKIKSTLEPVTAQTGKFVKNINEKKKEKHQSKERLIKPPGQSDAVSSSAKNMCTRSVTIRRIPKKECVCQKPQRSPRYLRANPAQAAHEDAPPSTHEGHWSRKWVEDSMSIPQLQRGFNLS